MFPPLVGAAGLSNHSVRIRGGGGVLGRARPGATRLPGLPAADAAFSLLYRALPSCGASGAQLRRCGALGKTCERAGDESELLCYTSPEFANSRSAVLSKLGVFLPGLAIRESS